MKEAKADIAICGKIQKNKLRLKTFKNLSFLDCTAPFQIGVVTDALSDIKDDDGKMPNLGPSRGKKS